MINTHDLHDQGLVKDANGRIVLWQWPNVPLLGWLVFKLLSIVVSSGSLKSGSAQLSTAFLFTWSYLEITRGVNYFRRILGVAVMVAIIMSFFIK